jgi:dephospho-CoA kinase
MLIGLTGGYCAGKNVVAGILERRGWACLDLDALGHEAIDLARDAVAARFGAAAMRPDGSVDRKAVARIVFADPVALADQEAIVHPIVYGMVEERLAAARESGRDACLNGALLYRTPLAGRCELILEVRAPLLLRLARARARDGASAGEALARIRRQGFIGRLRRASGRPIRVLRNASGLAALESSLERALAGPLEIAGRRG